MSATPVIAALSAGGDLRTWSLIVTVFGDMARAPGAEIPGPVLSALTARIGVKPEAMRVALHRLRKDGWIDARRDGRVSHYFLTDTGRAESVRVSARIYAPGPAAPERWHVAIAGPLDPPARLALESALAGRGYVALATGAWLGPGAAPDDLPAGLFTLDGTAPRLPDWLRETLMPPELARAYSAFDIALERAAQRLAKTPEPLPALDRAAVRVLLVHGWRRLVLRHPDLPDDFFPADWPGGRVRARVHEMLARIGETGLAELGQTTPA